METEELKIMGDCKLVATQSRWMPTTVDLEYIEHQADHWHSDTETSLAIDKETGLAIIEFLARNLSLYDDIAQITSEAEA